MEMIKDTEFGTRPRAFAVYEDTTFRRPFCVARINSRGEVVERVANRRTLAEAISEAESRAAAC